MKSFMFKKHEIKPARVIAIREPFEIAGGVAFLVEAKSGNADITTEFMLYKNRELAIKGYYEFIRKMKIAGYDHRFTKNATLREV